MRIIIAGIAVLVTLVPAAGATTTHSSPCHVKHTCPSDHASYRWNGWLCVKPTADERTATFKTKKVVAGRTYWCKR